MSNRPPYLNQLEQVLLKFSEETMLLEVLDGFIAGLLVCPEPIPTSEWLHWVWNSDGASRAVSERLEHLSRVLGLVMQYYNDVAGVLTKRPDRYRPLFAINGRDNDMLWELWIEGFEIAHKLRPSAWQTYFTADAKTTLAISGLLTLGVNQRNSPLSEEERDTLSVTAPDDIGRWIIALGKWRLANNDLTQVPIAISSPSDATATNEMCPCGSGKNYTKCCWIN
jgi:uncharacterized protein